MAGGRAKDSSPGPLAGVRAAEIDPFLAGYGLGAGIDDGLLAACVAVEAELREREWSAVERWLSFVDGDEIFPPSDEAARTRLAGDFVRLGWGVPAGAI